IGDQLARSVFPEATGEGPGAELVLAPIDDRMVDGPGRTGRAQAHKRRSSARWATDWPTRKKMAAARGVNVRRAVAKGGERTRSARQKCLLTLRYHSRGAAGWPMFAPAP